jgi:hypothetical protein
MFAIRSLAALGLLCVAVSAQSAMYLDASGRGQVLIFPYYTVNAGQSTLLTVVNDSDKGKLVYVRASEGMNDRKVLDFSLFLAPHDTWAGAVFALDGSGGANLVTDDTSCSAPLIRQSSNLPQLPDGRHYASFQAANYQNDNGPTDVTRTREGFVEVFELGELSAQDAQAASDRNCAAFGADGAQFAALSPPTGGLYGSAVVVNAAAGTYFTEPSTAIDGFSIVPLAVGADLSKGSTSSAGQTVQATVPISGRLQNLDYSLAHRIDAVSALLMAESLTGDFAFDASSGANTEWVITEPTKSFYTGATARAPYQETFGKRRAMSCMPYSPYLWDREQKGVKPTPALPPISETLRPNASLCYAVDVLQFGVLTRSSIVLGSTLNDALAGFAPLASSGSVNLYLGRPSQSVSPPTSFLPAGNSGPALRGLPAIGFQVSNYVNGNVTPGVLANYASAAMLHSHVNCSDANGAGKSCP